MDLPDKMNAVFLTGHGGFEKLEYTREAPLPVPSSDEVLIKVLAAGINNTDINTRIGWYSKKVTTGTNTGSDGFDDINDNDASRAGKPLLFPRIQGTDCCGLIVAVGENVDNSRIGERVLVRSLLLSPTDYKPYQYTTLGSDLDGAFAQYTKAPAKETYNVNCDWGNAELASIPYAYSTAEGMLNRASVGSETVLITGASGGVGSAAIQLCKRRGAKVIAVAGKSKLSNVAGLGADQVVERDADLIQMIGKNCVDVVIDLVAGDQFSSLLDVLKPGGRLITGGALAGPMVGLDARTLYLKDLTFFGCTYQEEKVFEDLISYIEAGEIKPLITKTYALRDIVAAQQDFIDKKYVGKLVLVPSHD